MVVVVASCVFFLLFNIINTVCNQINKCVFLWVHFACCSFLLKISNMTILKSCYTWRVFPISY